jgi:hypothetical protein
VSDSKHRSEIEVVANDTVAQQRLDEYIAKLQKAHDLAASIRIGGKGGSGGTPSGAATTADGSGGAGGGGGPGEGPGAGGGAGPGAAPSNPSTASTSREAKAAEKEAKAAATAQANADKAAADEKARREQAAHEARVRVANTGVQATGNVVGSASSGSPAFAAQMAGGLLGTASGFATNAAKMPFVGAALAAGAIGTLPVAAGVMQRYGLAHQAMGLERDQLAARMGGTDLSLGGSLMKKASYFYGFDPQEASQIGRGYVHGIGSRQHSEEGFRGVNPYYLSLLGQDTGTAARFLSTAGKGGGSSLGMEGTAGALRASYGTGYKQFGMSGSKLDEMIGRITNAVSGMAERGLSLNPESVLSLASSLDNTDKSFAGMKGVSAAGRLSSMGADSMRSLTGQFSGLADAAILAEAAKGGGSLIDVIGRGQRMSGRGVVDAMRNNLGAEGASYAALGKDFSAEQSLALGRGLKGATVTRDMPTINPDSQRINRANAGNQHEMLSLVANDPKKAIELLHNVHVLQMTLIRFSRSFDGFAASIIRKLEHL